MSNTELSDGFEYFMCDISFCVFQVNMIKEDGSVIHFNNPKVQASLSANTFAVTGHAETKRMYLCFVRLKK